MKIRTTLIWTIALLTLFSVSVGADPVKEGYAAYQRQEWELARQLWVPRAEEGDARAQLYMSILYSEGLGVERNTDEALRWLQSAAEGGMRTAQFYLGEHYRVGDWVERNDEKVAYWWQLAANAGMAKAQFKLGLLYALGKGVVHDRKQAIYWYRKAAENGMEEAKEALQLLGEAWGSPGSGDSPVELDLKLSDDDLGELNEEPEDAADAVQENKPGSEGGGAPEASGDETTSAAGEPLGMQGDGPLRRDIDWILEQPQKHYTLQLAASTSLGSLKQLAGQIDGGERVALFPYDRDQERWFGVLYGSFERYSDALFSSRYFSPEILQAKPWVRQFESLQELVRMCE